jgi:predicted HicB family RNase H-like nuclease
MSRKQMDLRETGTARLSLRITPDLKREIARLALEGGLSENAMAAKMLQAYVDQRMAKESIDGSKSGD